MLLKIGMHCVHVGSAVGWYCVVIIFCKINFLLLFIV